MLFDSGWATGSEGSEPESEGCIPMSASLNVATVESSQEETTMSLSTSRIVTTTASVLSAVALVSSGVAQAAVDQRGDRDKEAPGVTYVGDPWEQRVRDQFWTTQHIHDSWNRCHLGENVPMRIKQGIDCFPTLD
jgi:hypothetical protein